jgi:hypothetical protein
MTREKDPRAITLSEDARDDSRDAETEDTPGKGIVIASTLDGRLHGIDPSGGGLLWSLQDALGPMVVVTEKAHDASTRHQDIIPNPLKPSMNALPINKKKGVFIPELKAGGIGHLYYYEPGGEVKQLQIPLKDIINDHSVFINDNHVFTGKKLTHVLALDPKTGTVLQVYGEGASLESLDGSRNENKKLPSNTIFVGRTQYYLNIWDMESSTLLWNITYGEFIPSNLQGRPQTGPGSGDKTLQKGVVLDDGNGRVSLNLPGRKGKSLDLDLNSPFVSAFELDDKANSLAIYSPPLPTSKTKELGYIGQIDGSLYMIPGGSRKQNIQEIALFQPKISCQDGDPGYPDCLLGMHRVSGLMAEPPSQAFSKVFSLPVQISLVFGLIGILLFIYAKWTRAKEEKASTSIQTSDDTQQIQTGPKILQVSDSVLGTGSHGTVVYQGKFEGRDVAVKRLLKEFYHVADHEVKILQDSDYHPNVIRYFYKESCPGFTYLALELCPASLHDIIERADSESFKALRDDLDPKCAIQQILSGIHHLHRLKIVHRDLKPQNILIADSRINNKSRPRLLISDFGLGKRLEEEQSFFHVSHATAGGTQGWRAPECIAASHTLRPIDALKNSLESLLNNTYRITKAVDIFSAGCLMYYILTQGGHPFGDRFSRERNILKNNMMLEKLDRLTDGVLVRDLIKKMIAHSPSKRYVYTSRWISLAHFINLKQTRCVTGSITSIFLDCVDATRIPSRFQ